MKLSEFHSDAMCPKCGSVQFTLKYYDSVFERETSSYIECLFITCNRCGYIWYMKPKDSGHLRI